MFEIPILGDNLGKDVQKGMPINIVVEDILAPVAARGDVVQRIGKFDADGA